MKNYPPKISGLYLNDFLLQNRNIYSYVNNNYTIANKGVIPLCFYNHYMFNKIRNKNVSYQMISQRIKGKAINIIYYKPIKKINNLKE